MRRKSPALLRSCSALTKHACAMHIIGLIIQCNAILDSVVCVLLLVTRGRLISECCICFTNFIRRRQTPVSAFKLRPPHEKVEAPGEENCASQTRLQSRVPHAAGILGSSSVLGPQRCLTCLM